MHSIPIPARPRAIGTESPIDHRTRALRATVRYPLWPADCSTLSATTDGLHWLIEREFYRYCAGRNRKVGVSVWRETRRAVKETTTSLVPELLQNTEQTRNANLYFCILNFTFSMFRTI